jgi:nucleoside-diphosphate-sugar epimerase
LCDNQTRHTETSEVGKGISVEHESIAIVGFGDLGQRLSGRLPRTWRCVGLRRRAREVPPGVRGIAADLRDAESLSVLERLAPRALLVTLTPGERNAEAYEEGFRDAMQNILDGLGSHRPRQAFFVSSTRVYAEQDGGWVDEDSAVAKDDALSVAILEAERLLLDTLPGAVVLRAAGLYGHGPGPLLRAVAAGRLRARSPEVFGNRIHRDDVAAFIAYALENPPPHGVINLVDDSPVALQEIEEWLCGQLGRPYRPAEQAAPGTASAHKRVSNARLHATGYSLHYPDYRQGYAEVIRRWIDHSEREDGLDLH